MKTIKTIWPIFIAAILFASLSPAFASEQATPETKPVGVGGAGIGSGQVLEVFVWLILVVLLIFGVAWFVKRFSGLGPQGSQHIKTLAVLPVGTRERIAVLQIGDRQIVVGITPNQISTLLELDKPLEFSQADGEFARKLQSLLHRSQNDAKGDINGSA